MRVNHNAVSGHPASGGRNHAGHITCYHRGGGHKRLLRNVNFRYPSGVDKVNNHSNFEPQIGQAATLLPIDYAETQKPTVYYDPGRGGLLVSPKVRGNNLGVINTLSRLASTDDVLRAEISSRPRDTNTLALRSVNPVQSTEEAGSFKLSRVPAHTQVHSVELYKGKGAQLIRGAGCFGTVVNQVGEYTRLRLPSGEERLVHGDCHCLIGVVGGRSRKAWSLALHRRGLGKAGRSRWLGRRPTVRGTAMNPVDHPHGGGQGKTSGGRPSVTPWSVPKGVRTSAGRGAAFVVRKRV